MESVPKNDRMATRRSRTSRSCHFDDEVKRNPPPQAVCGGPVRLALASLHRGTDPLPDSGSRPAGPPGIVVPPRLIRRRYESDRHGVGPYKRTLHRRTGPASFNSTHSCGVLMVL